MLGFVQRHVLHTTARKTAPTPQRTLAKLWAAVGIPPTVFGGPLPPTHLLPRRWEEAAPVAAPPSTWLREQEPEQVALRSQIVDAAFSFHCTAAPQCSVFDQRCSIFVMKIWNSSPPPNMSTSQYFLGRTLASAIRSPPQTYLINDLESIQNRFAWFIHSSYSFDISVSFLQAQSGLQPLSLRHRIATFSLSYKLSYILFWPHSCLFSVLHSHLFSVSHAFILHLAQRLLKKKKTLRQASPITCFTI